GIFAIYLGVFDLFAHADGNNPNIWQICRYLWPKAGFNRRRHYFSIGLGSLCGFLGHALTDCISWSTRLRRWFDYGHGKYFGGRFIYPQRAWQGTRLAIEHVGGLSYRWANLRR